MTGNPPYFRIFQVQDGLMFLVHVLLELLGSVASAWLGSVVFAGRTKHDIRCFKQRIQLKQKGIPFASC